MEHIADDEEVYLDSCRSQKPLAKNHFPEGFYLYFSLSDRIMKFSFTKAHGGSKMTVE